nr:ribonuclease H-like domain-containing protein [Tanacetum cinerariifolium]
QWKNNWKGKIKAGMLDFEDVYYIEELKYYNLFSVSQMCDKKNKVLFTDTYYLVLSPDFKLPDENQVLLKIPRQHNMYCFNLKNVDPFGDLSCLFAKASIDESNKWHRRLHHVNFKNLNKLVKGNLVRGLPSKIFENDHTYVACQKGKKQRPLVRPRQVLVTKPQNKTPYELLTGRQPIISYLRPFGCHVTILNTIDHLGKFDRKSDSGFLVGCSLTSKDFRVYNLETKRVEDNLALISTAGPSVALNDNEPLYPDDPSIPHLEDIYSSLSEGIFTDSSYDDEGVVTDFNNLETTMTVSLTPTTRIHTIHLKTQILGDPLSAVQTRSKVHKNSEAHALVSYIHK